MQSQWIIACFLHHLTYVLSTRVKEIMIITGGFSSPLRPVTQSFDVFFDLRLNKRLSKQSGRRWFETPSHWVWRHCNVCLKAYGNWMVYIKCFNIKYVFFAAELKRDEITFMEYRNTKYLNKLDDIWDVCTLTKWFKVVSFAVVPV